MSNDTLFCKILLLSDQLNNIEYSGFFTENEVNKKSYPLYQELSALENQLYNSINGIEYLGIEPNEIAECAMLISSIKNKQKISA